MPTMNISLTAELASFVEREVKSGRYASASELVREGLRLLEREKAAYEEELALLKAAVAEGIADMEAGRFSDLTARELAEELLKESRRAP